MHQSETKIISNVKKEKKDFYSERAGMEEQNEKNPKQTRTLATECCSSPNT